MPASSGIEVPVGATVHETFSLAEWVSFGLMQRHTVGEGAALLWVFHFDCCSFEVCFANREWYMVGLSSEPFVEVEWACEVVRMIMSSHGQTSSTV